MKRKWRQADILYRIKIGEAIQQVCVRGWRGKKNEDRLKPNENSDIFLLLLLFIVTLGAKLMRDTNNFATNDLYEPKGVGKNPF